MKQKISTKIMIALIALILIAGTIMIFTKGLDFELKYKDSKKVELNLGKEFEISDIKQITDEIFEKQQVTIQAVEVYKDAVKITTTEITEEQKQELVTKINEKYETKLEVDNVKIEEIEHTRGRNIIKPYIVPFIITTAIILVYMMIRYYKLNSFKILIKSIGIIGLSQLVLLGIIAITRMPIGRLTISTILIVYILSMFICTTKFEQDLKKIENDNNKDKIKDKK